MGLSENSENPIFPMVLLIIIPFLNGYFIGKINPIFRQTQITMSSDSMANLRYFREKMLYVPVVNNPFHVSD